MPRELFHQTEKGFGNHDRVSGICIVPVALLAGGDKKTTKVAGGRRDHEPSADKVFEMPATTR